MRKSCSGGSRSIQKSLSTALTHLMSATTAVDAAIATAEQVRAELGEAQAKQTAEFTELQKVHQQADERSRARLELQQRVAKLDETEAEQVREKERWRSFSKAGASLRRAFYWSGNRFRRFATPWQASSRAKPAKRSGCVFFGTPMTSHTETC